MDFSLTDAQPRIDQDKYFCLPDQNSAEAFPSEGSLAFKRAPGTEGGLPHTFENGNWRLSTETEIREFLPGQERQWADLAQQMPSETIALYFATTENALHHLKCPERPLVPVRIPAERVS